MAGVPREILKWIQSLDLTWQIKTPKWDLTNGYLIAEIFSWYFPQEIQMHMFNNGTSLDSKQKNWSLLENFIKRHKLDIPEKYVEGTIHCKEGAAPLLLKRIYAVLTNRQLETGPSEENVDFTDDAYQSQLPIHARSTATQAVKNNLRVTEIMADSNIILGQQKAQAIIDNHIEHRRQERLDDPDRFDKKPTLGELAVRKPPPVSKETTQTTDMSKAAERASQGQNSASTLRGSSRTSMQEVPYKEIQVHQLSHGSSQSIAGC